MFGKHMVFVVCILLSVMKWYSTILPVANGKVDTSLERQ